MRCNHSEILWKIPPNYAGRRLVDWRVCHRATKCPVAMLVVDNYYSFAFSHRTTLIQEKIFTMYMHMVYRSNRHCWKTLELVIPHRCAVDTLRLVVESFTLQLLTFGIILFATSYTSSRVLAISPFMLRWAQSSVQVIPRHWIFSILPPVKCFSCIFCCFLCEVQATVRWKF